VAAIDCQQPAGALQAWLRSCRDALFDKPSCSGPPLLLPADPTLRATLFAPSDDAFTALLEQLGLTAEELLANTVR
jgi:hypothetical protein